MVNQWVSNELLETLSTLLTKSIEHNNAYKSDLFTISAEFLNGKTI
ncbi:hypothetical protein A79_2887 [Vibrio parahaemolyticus AQ3810]|nr:hypothetical protein VPUCM_20296 [Vibrio parahaemolyticus UCM-V493]ANZ11902.1 hypothetical protein VpaChn25_A0314 [Vibrio parahaemolyticus]EDM60385.1 hypothetical protein A79_2887 [Vibrio parahaemolyticus AQ3810]EFO42038.1 conserved hypothetical protein [Vibrio parahaemolyticus AN-5034]EQL90414.1 hypothetical protein D035_4180 [Vibrio parahaemolyticus VP250]EQL99800.1 hypothetical protein D040_0219 [Vibrio parahaemolyticus NIHCB0603]EQM07934.1 hypothetical protein D036_3386 [Vibrio parahae